MPSAVRRRSSLAGPVDAGEVGVGLVDAGLFDIVSGPRRGCSGRRVGSAPMELVIVVVVVVALLGLVVGVGIASRRRSGVDLEPPPATDAGVIEAPPTQVVEPPGIPEAPPVDEVEVIEAVEAVEVVEVVEAPLVEDVEAIGVEELEELVRPRFRDRLAKARTRFSGALGVLRGGRIDDTVWEDLEYALLGADVGVKATTEMLDAVRATVAEQRLTEGDELLAVLKAEMLRRLDGFDTSLHRSDTSPTIWLLVGVNGVGKTTTAGKLAHRQVVAGDKVMLAAGDTFRAAAAEQLTMWAERTGSSIVRGESGGDPSAVVFDAVAAAAAQGCDLVVADTAGRLHTKSNLMDELGKVRRVADKGEGSVTEVLLVLDATTGQNGLVQARQFTEAVELTGVVLTKLDGSAKGGIVLAIQSELGIPVKLVGLGETATDLVDFDATEFVEALFE